MVSNFTRLTAREITNNSFEISLLTMLLPAYTNTLPLPPPPPPAFFYVRDCGSPPLLRDVVCCVMLNKFCVY